MKKYNVKYLCNLGLLLQYRKINSNDEFIFFSILNDENRKNDYKDYEFKICGNSFIAYYFVLKKEKIISELYTCAKKFICDVQLIRGYGTEIEIYTKEINTLLVDDEYLDKRGYHEK